MRDPITRASIFLKKLVMWDVARWSNANGVVDAIYRAGGRLAFTRLGASLVVAFGVYGLWLWFQETRDPAMQLATIQGSYVARILVLLVLQIASISLPQASQPLASRHYQRHVRRIGFMFF